MGRKGIPQVFPGAQHSKEYFQSAIAGSKFVLEQLFFFFTHPDIHVPFNLARFMIFIMVKGICTVNEQILLKQMSKKARCGQCSQLTAHFVVRVKADLI